MPLPNANSVRELLEIYYGVAIFATPQESDVTVGTSAIRLGSHANTRISIVLTNWGSTNVSLGFSNGVTATTGTVLVAGGYLSFNWQDDGEIVNVDLYGIVASSTCSVHVVEYVLSGL